MKIVRILLRLCLGVAIVDLCVKLIAFPWMRSVLDIAWIGLPLVLVSLGLVASAPNSDGKPHGQPGVRSCLVAASAFVGVAVLLAGYIVHPWPLQEGLVQTISLYQRPWLVHRAYLSVWDGIWSPYNSAGSRFDSLLELLLAVLLPTVSLIALGAALTGTSKKSQSPTGRST